MRRFLPFALLLLAGCGGDDPASSSPTPGRRVGKPGIPAGSVEAVVVERPAADRAVIEARWKQPDGAGSLELVLPPGAGLVDGSSPVLLNPAFREGTVRWQVGYETGRPLDAVVRLSALTPSGPMYVEASVRLTE